MCLSTNVINNNLLLISFKNFRIYNIDLYFIKMISAYFNKIQFKPCIFTITTKKNNFF